MLSSRAEIFNAILCGDHYDIEQLNSILSDYPWFSMAAALIIRDLNGVGDGVRSAQLRYDHSLSFTANSYSGTKSLLRDKLYSLETNSESENIINSFLDKKITRTKIDDSEPVNMVVEQHEEDIVSEQYADILLKQGHYERAKSIFQKLILKNPEKSAYFASQIESIDNKYKV